METTHFPRMHVSLYVKDITATAHFYSKFFGQSPAKLRENYCKFELAEPGLIISFVQNAEKVASSFGHLGIQVGSEEELQQRLAATKTANVEVMEEMGTNCCYAAQDKYWVSDPDGHMWEVYYFHKDVEFNDPRYATNEAPACCLPADRQGTPGEAATPVKQKLSLGALTEAKAAVESGEAASCEPGSGCC